MGQVNHLAEDLRSKENHVWDAGSALLKSSMDLVPDQFDLDTRRAIADFRALFERIQGDQIGGRAYANLMREMERIFPIVMSTLSAWCVTNLSARGNIPLHPGMFNLVVIDEASQCNIPSVLPLPYRAKRAVIIGDPNQLRHITKIASRRDQMLQEKHKFETASDQSFLFSQQSLFDIAYRNAESPRSLREHFRSHRDIIDFSNQQWYRNQLLIFSNTDDLKTPAGVRPGIRWYNVKGRVERSRFFNGNINQGRQRRL